MSSKRQAELTQRSETVKLTGIEVYWRITIKAALMKLFPTGRRSHLLDFHRPEILGVDRPLTPESITCLRNLAAYKRPKARGRYPRSRSAAVLVALFVGRGGDLYVLLSRRSDKLRSYPGDTSLPGGKLERMDRSLENAARREAFEEIGLPLDKTKVPLLCVLEPFLAGNHIIVTPVAVLITDQTLRPILNSREVQSIFSHPLFGFLTTSPIRDPEPRSQRAPSFSTNDEELSTDSASPVVSPCTVTGPSSRDAPLVTVPDSSYTSSSFSETSVKTRHRVNSSTQALVASERPYHTYTDSAWHGKPVRMHSFLTGRESDGVKPVSGLTSAILIRTAQIGYARDPEYELRAPGQASLKERIAIAMREEESLRRACEDEGIHRDWVLREDPKTRGHETEDNASRNIRGKRIEWSRGRL